MTLIIEDMLYNHVHYLDIVPCIPSFDIPTIVYLPPYIFDYLLRNSQNLQIFSKSINRKKQK